MSPADPDFDQRAWSWVEHLRSEGTTPWTDWEGRPCAVPGLPVPGAAQLEVVRRLALAGGAPDFSQLADGVLALSGPGRGLPELPLPGSPVREGTGPRPLDPAEIPAQELIRVAEGVLVAQVLGHPVPAPAPPSNRHRPWQPAYRLVGAPVTAPRTSQALARAGRGEGGRRPRVLLVALPFDQLMGEVWSVRVQRSSDARWPRFWARWRKSDHLPVSADLVGLAEHWAAKVGRRRVEVVFAADPADAAQRVASLLGRTVDVPAEPSLSAESVELLRGVNRVLSIAVPESRHLELLSGVLVDLVAGPGQPWLAAPSGVRDWAVARSTRMVEELLEGGYAVHGEPGLLVPDLRSGHPDAPDPEVTLEIALHACLRAFGHEESR